MASLQSQQEQWPTSSGKYSIVVPSLKRADLLQRFLTYYNSSHCPLLDKIYVSWVDSAAALPDFLTDGRYSRRYPVEVLYPPSTSLNDRFAVPPTLATDAVLHIDDDLRVPCPDLDFAFGIWRREFPDRLVGFSARAHQRTRDGKWQYVWNVGPSNLGYSMVLTNAAFLHRRWMERYFLEVPEGVLALVTELRNCEDIAMNFLVAGATKKSPVFVQGNLTSINSWEGISKNGDHLVKRDTCLNEFARLFGSMPLERVQTYMKAVKGTAEQRTETDIEPTP